MMVLILVLSLAVLKQFQMGAIEHEFIQASLLVPNNLQRISQEGLWSHPSWLGRWYEAKAALKAFVNSPILGYGFGYEEFKSSYGLAEVPGGFYVHSIIPAWLVRTGLLGFCVLIWYFGSLLKLYYKASMESEEKDLRILFSGAIAGTVAILTVSQVTSFWEDRGFTLMIGMLSGLALTAQRSHANAIDRAL
jgi:O-antigen ligase